MLARQVQNPVREVIYRTRGRTSGPITRLVNPSDLGDLIKPFVFLDLAVFDSGPRTPMERLWHPHSGIATVTVMLEGGVRFPIAAPPMTYLLVGLKDSERWTYQPAQGHDVAWVAVSDGLLRTSSRIPAGEIAIFEPSEEPIDFLAHGATRFVIGSAAKHPHDLVLGNYSVHTSEEALGLGEVEIRRIREELHFDGTLRRGARYASEPAHE